MPTECRLLSFVIIILNVLRAEDKSNPQVISSNDDRSSLVDTHQPWKNLMAFLCTGGVEVVITRWHIVLLMLC